MFGMREPAFCLNDTELYGLIANLRSHGFMSLSQWTPKGILLLHTCKKCYHNMYLVP